MTEKITTKAIEILEDDGLDGITYLKLMDLSDMDIKKDLLRCKKETSLRVPITLVENTWLNRYDDVSIDHGWGNGYVDLPEGHRYYNVGYDELTNIDVDGGLTYSRMEDNGMWRVGFDTCHSWSTLKEHDEEWVENETYRLLIELYK